MKIEKTKMTKPPILTIYGEHGIGKSTFAASAPAPVFIRTEDRHGHLSVDAFPLAKKLDCVTNALTELLLEKHDFKTVVIDTLDWLQDLIFEHLCEKAGVDTIQHKKAFGFGAGYQQAESIWTKDILKVLSELNTQKKMWVIMLSHFKTRYIEDAEGNQYQKYDIDLQDRACARIHEFSDIVGFMEAKKSTEEKPSKGGGTFTRISNTGAVVLRLRPQPFFEAKRYGDLPPSLEIPQAGGFTVFLNALKKVGDTENGQP